MEFSCSSSGCCAIHLSNATAQCKTCTSCRCFSYALASCQFISRQRCQQFGHAAKQLVPRCRHGQLLDAVARRRLKLALVHRLILGSSLQSWRSQVGFCIRAASSTDPTVLYSDLLRSPHRPRKMMTWPLSGLSLCVVFTIAARPSKPLRISVFPATIHACVFNGNPIVRGMRGPLSSAARNRPDRSGL